MILLILFINKTKNIMHNSKIMDIGFISIYKIKNMDTFTI